MEEIKTIKQAIRLLDHYRGFRVKDIRQFEYIITDEEITDYSTEQEVIDFANNQLDSVDDLDIEDMEKDIKIIGECEEHS